GVNLVSGQALGRLLEIFATRYPVECVLLNACFSRTQAEEIVPHVNYVIGMSAEIGDAAALEFTVGFYKALGAGESYDFAFQLGCNAIQLAGIPEHLVPVILSRDSASADDTDAATHPPILSDRERASIAAEMDKLETFMKSGWWKEADVLTEEIMGRIVGRTLSEYMSTQDLCDFPCAELAKIDSLWLAHSGGRFGFSVQKAIWNAVGGLGMETKGDGDMERQFGDRTGWRVDERWLPYSEYTFDLTATPGHLPRHVYIHAFGWWVGKSSLLCARLEQCSSH
ncbi:MAG: GUN4 domain-containing protein, partial [Solirubrobacteraceae bacterium]